MASKKNEAAVEILTEVKGVGVATAEKLLGAFGTLAKIARADRDALLEAGIPSKTATSVLRWGKKAAPGTEKAAPKKPKPVVVPVPEKPAAAVRPSAPSARPRLPIPAPFGGRDVAIRTTPPPEVVDIQKVKQERAATAAAVVPKPAPAPRPARVRTTPQPRVVPQKRPVQPEKQLAGPFRGALGNQFVQCYLDRQDTKQFQGRTIYRVYDETKKKQLGYGERMRGLVYIQGG